MAPRTALMHQRRSALAIVLWPWGNGESHSHSASEYLSSPQNAGQRWEKRVSSSSQCSQAGQRQTLGSQTRILYLYTVPFTLETCKPRSKQIIKREMKQPTHLWCTEVPMLETGREPVPSPTAQLGSLPLWGRYRAKKSKRSYFSHSHLWTGPQSSALPSLGPCPD